MLHKLATMCYSITIYVYQAKTLLKMKTIVKY